MEFTEDLFKTWGRYGWRLCWRSLVRGRWPHVTLHLSATTYHRALLSRILWELKSGARVWIFFSFILLMFAKRHLICQAVLQALLSFLTGHLMNRYSTGQHQKGAHLFTAPEWFQAVCTLLFYASKTFFGKKKKSELTNYCLRICSQRCSSTFVQVMLSRSDTNVMQFKQQNNRWLLLLGRITFVLICAH